MVWAGGSMVRDDRAEEHMVRRGWSSIATDWMRRSRRSMRLVRRPVVDMMGSYIFWMALRSALGVFLSFFLVSAFLDCWFCFCFFFLGVGVVLALVLVLALAKLEDEVRCPVLDRAGITLRPRWFLMRRIMDSMASSFMRRLSMFGVTMMDKRMVAACIPWRRVMKRCIPGENVRIFLLYQDICCECINSVDTICQYNKGHQSVSIGLMNTSHHSQNFQALQIQNGTTKNVWTYNAPENQHQHQDFSQRHSSLPESYRQKLHSWHDPLINHRATWENQHQSRTNHYHCLG